MVANTMNAVATIPVLKLVNGETLKVRVYPWYNGAATGKTICLSDVKISGVALPTSGLSINESSKNNLEWVVQDGFVVIKNVPANSKITIYDLTGKLIYKSLNNNETLLYIKSPANQGVYIGKVESQESTLTSKFLVP